MMRSNCQKPAAAALLACFAFLAVSPAAARPKDLTWKPVTMALLKLNNHPVKTWDILQPDKDRNLVLVQVNKRWFLFQLKQKRLYSVARSLYKADGDNLIGPGPDRDTPRVKTDGWDSHDVGPAQQITVTLAESGDVLAIELPHPLAVY
jgi:hypothetical protein